MSIIATVILMAAVCTPTIVLMIMWRRLFKKMGRGMRSQG